MATTRTLIKSGDGNATAALVAGTVTNVAVVTLPSDPGYEYDVSVSVMFKTAGTTLQASTLFGNYSVLTRVGTCVTGQIIPSGARAGTMDVVNTPASNISDLVLSTSGGSANTSSAFNTGASSLMTVKYGPGAAVTVSINSAAADTYYLHYSYIGRKTITESF